MVTPLIQFKDFTFQYKSQQNPTLKNINLEIYPGEKVLILGPSGSGKSTLGQCINGLIPNRFPGKITGECLVNGRSIKQTSIYDLAKDVGTVLQDSDAQFVGLNVGEDIAFSLENQAIERSQMKTMVQKAADKLGVGNQLDQLPYALSGGQKQRVSVAGVLHEDIDILLLDEPLAALDPQMGQTMIEIIDEFNQVDNKTIVLIEHRLEEVLHRPIDRIVLMNRGEIVTIQTPDQLLASGILEHYGIREPLYISALRRLYGGFTQTKALTNQETIEIAPFKEQEITLTKRASINQVSEEVIISLDNLAFSYTEDPFIKIPKLSFYKGEKVAILGENGSGKTTLARLLTGIVKPQQGTVQRVGNPLTIKEIAETIGYVMQNPNQMLVASTLLEEVSLGLNYRNVSKAEIEKRTTEILKLTGLYRMRNWPISALSYGQKKRLSVAVILVLQPDCIILDEPTAGQDYAHYREMMSFVETLNREYQITILFITHDMHLALEHTERALVLEKGRIIADAPTFEVLDNEPLLERASLRKTSIFDFARRLNQPVEAFVRTFIEKENEVTAYESTILD
ncbi:DUF3744 domain-containing protein [Globicatella sulfidifaciens]|uniref:ATP-binding cassette domain-containing protein n=1 Tax=Globicatella sulfidifaciens TaxID=136093 RepID=A0A7X8H0A7_9LACT|nr:DUF3744 domain-containing protein [Globicatella sulfidifaciens]NLJ18523.1 ATP-binding cassette domain-containing protein [Globicatella sulfidifaciens]